MRTLPIGGIKGLGVRRRRFAGLGLRHDDDDKIEEGLHFSDQAREERPTDPVPSFNAAAGLLALGREDEARDAYREAVERTVFIDSRHKERRNDVAAYEFFLGEALTDLESIAAARPRLRHAVDEAKRSIVAPITRAAYAEPLESKNPSPPAPANGKRSTTSSQFFTSQMMPAASAAIATASST